MLVTSGGRSKVLTSEETVEKEVSYLGGLFFSHANRMLRIGASENGLTEDEDCLPSFPSRLNCSTAHDHLVHVHEVSAVSETASVWHLLKTLLSAHTRSIAVLWLLKLFQITLSFSCPIFLNMILDFVSTDDRGPGSLRRGISIIIGLSLSFLLTALVNTQISMRAAELQIQINAALLKAVFSRMAGLPLSKWRLSEGKALALIQVDTERVAQCVASLSDLWGMPLQVVIALYLLYTQIKFVFFVGLGILVLALGLNSIITKQIMQAAAWEMKAKDSRINALWESLRLILPLKMMGNEWLIVERVGVARNDELKALRKRKYLDCICVWTWVCLPVLLPLGTFIFARESLSATDIFTTLALLAMLIFPMNAFPWVINGCAEALVSGRRVASALWCADTGKMCMTTVGDSPSCNPANTDGGDLMDAESRDASCLLKVHGALWQWQEGSVSVDADERGEAKSQSSHASDGAESIAASMRATTTPFTIDIGVNQQLTFRAAQVVGVVGAVGSGKTAFLLGLLGELHLRRGVCRTWGAAVSYCPQLPVIHTTTVRENILCGAAYEPARYESILRGCCLTDEVNAMSSRDATAVSPSRLSGGQRLRVGIARALYAQSSRIVLLDDPYSALDPSTCETVRKFIFDHAAESRRLILVASHNVRLLTGSAEILECIRDEHCGTSAIKAHHAGSDSYAALLTAIPPSHPGAGAGAFVTDNANASSVDVIKGAGNEESDSDSDSQGEERLARGVIKSETYWAYFSAFGLCNVGTLLISMVCMQASSDGIAYYYSYWADNMDVISRPDFLRTAGMIAGANVCFALVRSFIFAIGALKASRGFHERLTASVFGASAAFFDTTPVGNIINRFGKDTNIVDDQLNSVLNIVLAQTFMLAGNLVVIAVSNYYVTFVLLAVLVVYYFLQRFYRKTSRAVRRLQSMSRSPLYSVVTDCFSNGPQLRSLRAVQYFSGQVAERVDHVNRIFHASVVASCWLSMRLQFLGALVAVSFASFAIFTALYDTSAALPAGVLGLATIYTFSLVSKLNSLVSSSTELEQEMVSVERIREYSHLEDERSRLRGVGKAPAARSVEEEEYGATSSSSFYERSGREKEGEEEEEEEGDEQHIRSPLLQGGGFLKEPSSNSASRSERTGVRFARETDRQAVGGGQQRERGRLSFSNVSMRYAPHLPDALSNVSVTIAAGSRVAIIGRSGSGKSSIFRLISRLNTPYEGAIFLDGVDTSSMDLQALRSRLYVISQDPLVLSGTVSYNLDPSGLHTREEVLEALSASGFSDTFAASDRAALPEMLITQSGANLSVGQKQLLGLGRALLSPSCDLLLIDEGTSGVDEASCELMKAALLRLCDRMQCSLLIITHSKNGFYTLCDTVITLSQGRIV